jgi:hypothetical protein
MEELFAIAVFLIFIHTLKVLLFCSPFLDSELHTDVRTRAQDLKKESAKF